MNTIIIVIVALAAIAIVYSIFKSDKKSKAKATEVANSQTTPVNPPPAEDPLDRQGTEPKN